MEPERVGADVLLIGGAGLVGRHLRAALRGRSVATTYHREPVPDGIPLDVTDSAALRALVARLRPSVVVLAAAEAYVERCEREPELTRRVNVEAAAVVTEASRAIGALVVVFSSEYVFDGRAGPYREADAVNPVNEYGRQKAALEVIARTHERHLVCRTSGVFGWEPAGKNFVCQLLRHLRAGREFVVPSDQVVTPTYAPELAQAVVALVEGGHIGTFHVVGPRVIGRHEFALLAAETFALPGSLIRAKPTAEIGLAAPRPRECGLRDDRLRETLGGALLDPAEGLRAMRVGESAAAQP